MCSPQQDCMVQYKANQVCLTCFDAKCAVQNLLANTFTMKVGVGVTAPGGAVAIG